MKKIKVSICTGTACFVMGASEIMLLEEELSPELRDMVEIEGVTCLDLCKDAACGKAPFVRINDEILAQATLLSVLEKIQQLANG
ncbi:MAG: NAD(P)H-dependent oxidoreductase subunit E [Spirochaetaceae bacterium]|nr:NAD(P)H-dependent oxidoreductase subunit E [Spirochaetaceae bacterium]MBR2461725.1 NAD(P)H-dependent oxidoreductase subunit E [Spirochaetaceae bacterium]